ncbi:invasion protein CiaB [Nitratiruptor tergarcus]|uniref:DUF7897 domain-containing protein n=1 Tax=Nitratiruptor tergarcus DSM 16512 TaxID=1069081 RepID=A0A1W1WR40_9BACT|nr:invasion protein CiaB [Nitratiruptor tergarcus]SMC08480.1 hypothetical protein SAMN05660197_0232 [Nitratiruptor tergarcus DSM 16512]
MREKFFEDLRKIYTLLEAEQKELQRFYEILQPHRSLVDVKVAEYEDLIYDFLQFIGLEVSSETKLAAINRIVNLREDMLLQVISDKEEEEQIKVKERAFVWVSQFYLARFEQLLQTIEAQELLSPFYRTLVRHAHLIGEAFSSWQSSWMAAIIYGINKELFRIFNGDEEKIFEMLNAKKLLDRGHGGEVGDRSYSVLVMEEDGSFKRVAYAEAFSKEVEQVCKRIDNALQALAKYEDEVFHKKEEWLVYFVKIKEALLEKDPDRLIPAWADVDRAWMRIDTPLQLGHPLEYYEDRYRKAVALEWDVRIVDPNYKAGERVKKIELAFRKLYDEIGIEKPSIYRQTLQSLQKVQLYVGRPLLFYGSEFNGLFSAQVVPNDEVVSKEMGKKIFAYPDMILQTKKAKPKMRLTYEIYGKEGAQKIYSLLENEEAWYAVYDITTIGHEYGHILWMDEESEAVMNRSGMFKLAEEFKATTGGLVAYFMFEEERYWEELLLDHIQRSVSLIGWMEVEEVLPYYVEGLLHLHGLFETGVLTFDTKLQMHITKQNFAKLKRWYLQVYKDLAKVYLLKENVKNFLDKFIVKGKNVYLPLDEKVGSFVQFYYELYTKIGREIVTSE